MILTDLLARPEGKTLEFKRDLSSPDGVLRTLAAFANTGGGTVLIGVEDTTRHVRGVADPLTQEERLANLVSDLIAPRLIPEIELLRWRGTHVLAVQVYPSAARPHHLRREGEDNGTYVRIGSTNRRADTALIAEMRRYARAESYDEQPVPELGPQAIDFRAACECFAAVRKLARRDLETLRLVTTHQGRRVPTVGGVLLFGHDRGRQFPEAWIQAGRFAGTDRSRIVDQAELRQYPVPAIEAAIAFVHKHLLFGAEIGAVRREDRWSVPPVAVREAVINAVVHADYSQSGAPIRIAIHDDRLEIENPGLLPFGLTIDDLRHGVSRLRNRVIGRVLHKLGLVEQWGSGIQRMTAACRAAGVPEPELAEIGMRFRVTLRTQATGAPAVDAIDQKVLDLLADGDGRRTTAIAGHIGLTPRATRTRLAALVGQGLLCEIGSGPSDPRRTYVGTQRK